MKNSILVKIINRIALILLILFFIIVLTGQYYLSKAYDLIIGEFIIMGFMYFGLIGYLTNSIFSRLTQIHYKENNYIAKFINIVICIVSIVLMLILPFLYQA